MKALRKRLRMRRPRPTSNEATPQTDEMYSGCGEGVSALVMFGLDLNGFCHRQLREHLAQLLGLDLATYPRRLMRRFCA